MKRLAVVPSDRMEDYLNQGYSAPYLKDYYNPGGFFDEVYLLSNLEKDHPGLLGMKVMRTTPVDLPKRLKDLNINIVRAYGGNWACTYACEHKAMGVPVVVSVHDTSPLKLYDSIKHADYVLCMSKAVKDLVLSKFDRKDRVWILPNRVDFKVMGPKAQDNFKDLDEKYPFVYKILHVGRLSEEKNLDTLIKALPFLGDDYAVIAIGHGDCAVYKKMALELNVLQHVFFIDAVPNQELARYYSWCTCMCTPSRREGFGMVFIEALACACVVVTSDIAPLNEYIAHGENGLLVKDFEDPESLGKMVQKACLDEDLRTKIHGKARESVRIFEKETIDQQEINFYKKILDMESQGKITQSSKLNNSYQKALAWVKSNSIPGQGIIVNTQQRVTYLEVTGYFIPTLMDAKESGLARSYAEFMVSMQQADGAYEGPDGKKYVFDTGQALRGLMAASQSWPEFKPAALKAADYLLSQMQTSGLFNFNYDYAIPPEIPLFILPALKEAGKVFQRSEYTQAAQRSLAYYKQQAKVLNPKYLTHFLAYILDGLIDMGESDFVRPFVQDLFTKQGKDGRIRAYAGAHWVCSVGVAQLAIVGYKLGMHKNADLALDYVASIQNPSGGFYGSYGWGAKYFPKAEISWANKFFLDAIHLKRKLG